ncbi:sulfite exporter TauE/SafE family protein [Sulfurivirga sp.]|uniref:sulfite exporter TauE/SafE family protein n=1 Tax=Sulfurivirga sp. TaxID=2614236 RepID=UPI00345BC08C
MNWEMLASAMLVGLLGGVHCLGMCGGVVGTLTFGLPKSVQQARARTLLYQLAYNLGRISSYAVAGALFGWLGASLTNLAVFLPAQQVLQAVAGLLMISLGLYLAGVWRGIVAIEKLGGRLWRRIQPWAQKLTPVRSLPQAWLYGAVWGWLPCGLVYSMLVWALASGGALQGAALLAAFGLGTLPNLMLMGVFAFYFTRLAQKVWLQRLAGALVAGFGLWQLYLAASVTVAAG